MLRCILIAGRATRLNHTGHFGKLVNGEIDQLFLSKYLLHLHIPQLCSENLQVNIMPLPSSHLEDFAERDCLVRGLNYSNPSNKNSKRQFEPEPEEPEDCWNGRLTVDH